MDGLPFGCRLRRQLGGLCARLFVTERSGGAGPNGADLSHGEFWRLRFDAARVLTAKFVHVGVLVLAPFDHTRFRPMRSRAYGTSHDTQQNPLVEILNATDGLGSRSLSFTSSLFHRCVIRYIAGILLA